MHKAKMMKARVFIGMNGVTPAVLSASEKAFAGRCHFNTESDVIRIKIQATFKGDVLKVAEQISIFTQAEVLGIDGNFIVLWKRTDNEK